MHGTLIVTFGLVLCALATAATPAQQLVQIGKSASGFTRLHVAEALVNIGDPADAAACLQQAEPSTQPAVGYVVVTWRVLAMANVDSAANISRIKHVALTPGSPDRLHSAEALAKLKAPRDEEVQHAFQAWVNDATED